MKSQTSDNDIIETITTIKSEANDSQFSDDAPNKSST